MDETQKNDSPIEPGDEKRGNQQAGDPEAAFSPEDLKDLTSGLKDEGIEINPTD